MTNSINFVSFGSFILPFRFAFDSLPTPTLLNEKVSLNDLAPARDRAKKKARAEGNE